MEYIGTVNFDLVELPTWNDTSVEAGYNNISELLTQIVEDWRRYKNLIPPMKSRSNSVFARTMMVEFIYKTSVGESVGLQSKEDIKAAIDAYTNNREINDAANYGFKLLKEKEGKETINIYIALEYISKLRDEMENTGKLTVQQICDIHRILMTGLRDDAGELRKYDVFTLCGEMHLYPEPSIAEQILYACVDHHCIQMSRHKLAMSSDDALSITNVEFIFKRAARLLFDFVDAHPFGDGNGRTCRLLANYVMSLIMPFPVAPSCGEGKNMKDCYLKAVIECRDNREKGPGALASMLIEDTWRGWKRFFQHISQ